MSTRREIMSREVCHWCHAGNDVSAGPTICHYCKHRADVPRAQCDCPKCKGEYLCHKCGQRSFSQGGLPICCHCGAKSKEKQQ